MSWVPDSRTAGYLGPNSSPAPLESDPWTDFLQALIAGVTGLDPTLVRPRWQPTPPPTPALNVTWAAIGVMDSDADWQPAVIHVGTGDGYDALQRMETSTLLCSFYGPLCQDYASLLRDGLFIDQNLAGLRAAAVAIIEVQKFTRNADLYREQFRDRVDVPVIVRREIRRDYPVLNLLRARGIIKANAPFKSTRVVDSNFDTANGPVD